MKVEGSFPGLARYFTKELQIKHWYLTPIALVIFSKGRVAVDSEVFLGLSTYFQANAITLLARPVHF